MRFRTGACGPPPAVGHARSVPRDAGLEASATLGVDLCHVGAQGLPHLEVVSGSATVSGGRREHSPAHIFLSDVLTMQRTHCEGARVALDRLEELAHLGVEPRHGNVLTANASEAHTPSASGIGASAVAQRTLAVRTEVQR